jgi:hypothetical protein
MDKAALGQDFSEHFGFPCQAFHRLPHTHHLHHHNHHHYHPVSAQYAIEWPQQ